MATDKDSSKDVPLDETRRSCPHCSTRMSSILHDKHSFCSTCRGIECSPDNKCDECRLWTEEEFVKYFKHCKSLKSKSKARKSKAKGDDEDRAFSVDSNLSAVLGAENVNSGDRLDEAKVRELISSEFARLTDTIAASMQDSVLALDAHIDERIARQANPSLSDIPSQAPVQPSLSHGQQDSSCLTPHRRYGHLEGERREPELAELTNVSPDMSLARFLADAKAKGLEIP